MISKFRILLVGFILVGAAYAGPFGLSQGMPLSAFKGKNKQMTGMLYELTEVPSPHPEFDHYMVIISDTVGLGKIIARGGQIETNPQGSQLHYKFDALLEALTKKYGKPKMNDFLAEGSLFNAPGDWMVALCRKERTLVAFWAADDVKLPDQLHGIILEVLGDSNTEGHLELTYEFENFPAIAKEIKQAQDAAL